MCKSDSVCLSSEVRNTGGVCVCVCVSEMMKVVCVLSVFMCSCKMLMSSQSCHASMMMNVYVEREREVCVVSCCVHTDHMKFLQCIYHFYVWLFTSIDHCLHLCSIVDVCLRLFTYVFRLINSGHGKAQLACSIDPEIYESLLHRASTISYGSTYTH